MIGKTLALGAQTRTTSPRTWAHGGQAGKLRALMPSNTGQPGGGKTGQQMTHYIIEEGPGWTFHGGTWTRWTWTSAGEAREGRSQGQGSTNTSKVCLPRMQGCGMGKAWAESGMRRLPDSHGLSPESHTQRRYDPILNRRMAE